MKQIGIVVAVVGSKLAALDRESNGQIIGNILPQTTDLE
jgi:hypothetical protein